MPLTPFTHPDSGLRDERPPLKDTRDGTTRPPSDPRLFWGLLLALVTVIGGLLWWM